MTNNELWHFSQGGFDLGDKATNTEWKFNVEGRTLYVGFKFTDSKQDWRQNFFFLPRLKKPYKGMKVRWFAHAGFLLKWKAIEDQVANKMVELQVNSNFDKVIAVGHSQGGAIATLFHEWFKFHFGNTLIETITFGAPRVVWLWNFGKIKNRFEGITSYRTFMDIVPHVPPKIFGYRDTGHKVILGEKKFHIPTPKVILHDHTCYGDLLV